MTPSNPPAAQEIPTMTAPILFLPGLLCDYRLFEAQIKLLQAATPCFVADLTICDSIPKLAEATMQQVLSQNPKWSVVALSMGGYVAMELMRRFPERIDRLVLMNSSARADTDEQKATRRGLIALADQGRFLGVAPRLMPRLLHPKNLENSEITGVITAMAESIGKEAFIKQQTAIMNRVDSRESLSQIKARTLIVASEQDAITPKELLIEISNLIGNSHLELIENSGHLTPLEAPEETYQHLHNFLLS